MNLAQLIAKEIQIGFRYYAHQARTRILGVVGYPKTLSSKSDDDWNAKVEEQRRILDAEQAQKHQAMMSKMTWSERAHHVYETTFSPRAASAQLLQQCTNAHAAHVAAELGVDVRGIKIEVETHHGEKNASLGSRVIAYIDAPKSSDEEISELVRRVRKECPMAKMYGDDLEWKRQK